MVREYIKAHLADPKVLHGKVGFVVIATDDDKNTETGICDVCGKEYTYVPDLCPAQAIACKGCETEWVPVVKNEPVAAIEINDGRPLTCPDCGGTRKGRGYVHSNECPTLSSNKSIKTCSSCGGPASGKGYAHTADCPTQQKKPVETCPKCGGPKRGRGFIHKDDCSERKSINIVKSKPVETCPKCGGPKRGRGFTHKDGCPEVKAAKAQKKHPRTARMPRLR